jgi:DNA-binding CsgD family transcriptional regulator
MLAATARAAFAVGLRAEGRHLVSGLETDSDDLDPELAVLRAHEALAFHRMDADALGQRAAALAQGTGRMDLGCEALWVAARAAKWTDAAEGTRVLHRALALSRTHRLPLWEVRVLAELGTMDMMARSDPTQFVAAREVAVAGGMAGMVAKIDLHLGEITFDREGAVAGYSIVSHADEEARRLRLLSLYAQSRAHVAMCLAMGDGTVLPGWSRSPTPADFHAVIAQAVDVGERSNPVPWLNVVVGVQAWLSGDNAAAIRLIRQGSPQNETKMLPLWGFGMLLDVVDGADPSEAFGPPELVVHHVGRSALAYATAINDLRQGRPATDSIAEAELCLGLAPYGGNILRTIAAVPMVKAGLSQAESWLREADSFFGARSERALQRLARAGLAEIGAKIPRARSSMVPPRLARVGITARELEILRLVNAGLSNHEISDRLVISVRTVESHVSSLLLKTGQTTRDQLPRAAID